MTLTKESAMWSSPWGFPQQQQQPFIIIPAPGYNQTQQQPEDPFTIQKKFEKWMEKRERKKKAADASNKKPEPPKTGMKKMSDKTFTYWDVMKFVIALGPPATYMWSLLMIHMWNNLKDAISTLH